MTYAQVLNGSVVNVIELDDASLIPLFSAGFDYFLQVDQLSAVPGIGWFYDIPSGNFFPPAIIALIDNSLVVGLVNNCAAYITNNAGSHQYLVDVTNQYPAVEVGFAYNSSGGTFTPSQAYYQTLIAQAAVFGNSLMVQFAATNAKGGITQAGMTAAVLSYTGSLIPAMTTGSLYEAIAIINGMIADSSSTKASLAPYITNDILYTYLNLIQDWLEIPETPNPGS